MTNQTTSSGNDMISTTNIRITFYISILTTALTAITLGIAFCTPPLSGPFCNTGCYHYPFLDIASRFPRDYIWMYPAMVATSFYLVLMVCVHNLASRRHKLFTQSGLAFATISTATLLLDYFLQISVVQPGILNGETDGISLISQYNPHGLFIAFEEIGFMMMSTSFLCIASTFTSGKLERSIKWIFIIAFSLTMLAFLLFTIFLGVHREYYFEITAITINWLALIIAGVLLSIVLFRKKRECKSIWVN